MRAGRPRRSGTQLRVLLGTAPLARPSDRVQALSRLLLLLALVASVPLTVVVTAGVHGALAARSAAERAERATVAATLLADAGPAPVPAGPGAPTDRHRATRAVWRTGALVRTGPVDAPPGARAGTVVPIWVDRSGTPAAAPLTDADVAADTFSAAVLAAVVLSGTALVAHGAVLWLLQRSRMRRWAREWAAVEPSWAGRS